MKGKEEGVQQTFCLTKNKKRIWEVAGNFFKGHTREERRGWENVKQDCRVCFLSWIETHAGRVKGDEERGGEVRVSQASHTPRAAQILCQTIPPMPSGVQEQPSPLLTPFFTIITNTPFARAPHTLPSPLSPLSSPTNHNFLPLFLSRD